MSNKEQKLRNNLYKTLTEYLSLIHILENVVAFFNASLSSTKGSNKSSTGIK